MKVRELIADSTFVPGGDRASPTPPRVSVILPTFRRGDSGFLSRAIESVLGQSLRGLELIIVDDASTDSTAQVIAEAMGDDPRVSVIRHARNIGLPAVSEYEAYLRARGDRIAFAFDDTTFTPTALEQLLRESDEHPRALVVGWVQAHFSATDHAPAHTEQLGKGVAEDQLLSGNVIANSAVLAPREVLDEIGLYDPHVSLARMCDYDLWLRARRQVPLRFVDVPVGEEHGAATLDSLGATYPLDQWTADDRMRQSRTALLRPDAFGEIDVFDTASFQSERSRAAVRTLTEGHRATRSWMTEPSRPAERGGIVPRVIVLAQPINASTQLVFEALRDDERLHVRILDPRTRSLAELLEADVLVVSRQIRRFADWVGSASAMKLPVYFYLDDNLPLMRDMRELDAAWEEYDPATMRTELSEFDGVFASSDALAESFREQGLHATVTTLPTSAPRSLVVARQHVDPPVLNTTMPLAVALFIGIHRMRGFTAELLPALHTVARQTGQRLCVLVPAPFADALPHPPDDSFVVVQPFAVSLDYFVAIRTLRDAGAAILAVPESPTLNGPYKTLHSLQSAALLGANLVVPDSPPFTDVRGTPGVELADAGLGVEGWAIALRRAVERRLANPGSGVGAVELVERFNSRAGADALLGALSPLAPLVEPRDRIQRLASWYARQLALTRVQVDLQLREPQRLLTTNDAFGSLIVDLHRAVRGSRRLSAFRRAPGALQRFPLSAQRGERVEISAPLTGHPYISYSVPLGAGSYSEAELMVWASALPEDLIGIELVDNGGRILLHAVEALPRSDLVERVVFRTDGLSVESASRFELRVFARTNQPAFLLEAVQRGRFGLRRAVARPLIHWRTSS